MIYSAEAPPSGSERSECLTPLLACRDRCSHGAEGRDDTSHWPSRERCIAAQIRLDSLASEESHQQAHRRARIFAVERVHRSTPTVKPFPVNHASIEVPVDADAKQAQTSHRRRNVGPGPEPLKLARPLGDRREQESPMRDGLVSRDAADALQS